MIASIARTCALALASLALVATGPVSAVETHPAIRAVPVPELYTLFTPDDYPVEAVARDEEGTVQFRLSIGADGRPTGCDVTGSSGSALLDTTTCRLLLERSRFRPAKDAAGKPVPDTHRGRISWNAPEEAEGENVALPPASAAAMQLWTYCAHGEVSKLALSTIAPAAAAERALTACSSQEARTFREMTQEKVPEFNPSRDGRLIRAELARALSSFVQATRAALNSPLKQ